MYIAEFSKLVGTSTKTIRYYEEIGLLPEPFRKGKYRVYDHTYVETVKQIKLAQSLGFSLNKIKALCQGQNIKRGLPKQVIDSALQYQKEKINQQIEELQLQLTKISDIEKQLNCSNCA
jgi:MerR family transcriptional regulator, copper efflux regulator